MPEFFGRRYSSKGLKIGASIITFLFLIPYTASLYNGLSRLFEMAFGLDYTVCIVVMAILTGIYVIAGGYMATAINDFIQGMIMLLGIIAVIAAILASKGGFMEALNGLASVSDPAVSSVPGVFNSFFGPDPLGLLGVVILTSLGTWGLPQMVQKFYAIKSEASVRKGAIISTLFAVIVAGGCYFLGGFGRLFSDSIELSANGIPVGGYDAIIPSMLNGLHNDLLIAVVVILVLSASMSTLSSLVLASSSTITLDLLKGNIVKNMDEKRQVRIIRIFVVVFILISAAIAVFQYRSSQSATSSNSATFIAQLMGVSWGALAGAFLAPFLYSLYWRRTTKASCWVCFIFGAVLMILNMLFRSSFPAVLQSPINCGAFAMLAGLILVPLVSVFTPKPDAELVDGSFACYDVKVSVSQKRALTD